MYRLVSRPFLLAGLCLSALLAVPGAALALPDYTVGVTPDYQEVPGGSRIIFTATLYRNGEEKYTDHHWAWEADGGHFLYGRKTDATQNVWVAPHRPGTYTIRVTTERAQRDGSYGEAQVVVGRGRPAPRACARHWAKFSQASYRVQCGSSYPLTPETCGCEGYSWTWSCSSGRVHDGQYTPPDVAGTYWIEGYDATYGQRIRCEVVVDCAPRVARVVITPARIECAPGELVRLSVVAYDVHGRPIGDCQWEYDCDGGTLDESLCYRAPDHPGRYVLVLRSSYGGEGRAEIHVRHSVARCSIEPERIECSPGERVAVSAWAWDGRGSRLDGYGDWEWGCTGGSMEGGYYVAGSEAGTYRVWVRERGCGQTCAIEVVIRSAIHLVHISPRVVVLRPGQTVQFTVQGYDTYNRPAHCSNATFRFDGGTMTQDGWYTAGRGVGRHYRVEVQHPSGASDWADVFITR